MSRALKAGGVMGEAVKKRLFDALEIVMLAAVPTVLALCAYFQLSSAAFLTVAVAVAAVLPFFARFESAHPRPRDFMPIVLLCAIASAGRIIFGPFPGVQPVTAIVIIAGMSFGRQSGFLVGALTALASNMFFGQGAWTPWQMYSWGLVGYLAGVIFAKGLPRRKWTVLVYGALASLGYGLVMDTWTVVGFLNPITLIGAVSTYAAGMVVNIPHAISTVVFLLPTMGSWTRKFARIKRKYGIGVQS